MQAHLSYFPLKTHYNHLPLDYQHQLTVALKLNDQIVDVKKLLTLYTLIRYFEFQLLGGGEQITFSV